MPGDGKTTCRYCDSPIRLEILATGVHYAKRVCSVCGKINGFEPKPDNDQTKYRRPAAHRDLVGKFSRGFCELCLIRESDLPKGRTLEAQHVLEFQDDGDPSRENIWIVCTGCHRLIHWVRTYRIGEHAEVARA